VQNKRQRGSHGSNDEGIFISALNSLRYRYESIKAMGKAKSIATVLVRTSTRRALDNLRGGIQEDVCC